MTVSRGKLLHHVIVPVALLVAVSMAVVVGFTWFSARKQDEVALRQSIETVRGAIERELAKIGLAAKDYTWWDEAVLNLMSRSTRIGRTTTSVPTSITSTGTS